MTWLSALVMGLVAGAAAAQPVPNETDERLLHAHDITTDDAGLLHFFRERTLSNEQVAALQVKLKQLGAATYGTRTRAAADLVKAGLNAKALLLDVTQNPATDREVSRRAELCLRQIGEGQEVAQAQAAARLLARRKSPEAAATLINYVPFAGDPQIVPVVQEALNGLAVRDGRANAAVLQAVHDAHPGKRGAAGVALIRAGGLTYKSAVAHLLDDRAPAVRVPIALALVEAKDKDAVPVLIERLADAPADQLWQVVELLERIAGDKSPAVYASSKTPPAKVRDAWRQWWTANAAAVNLTKLSDVPPHLGYTLITMRMAVKVVAGARVGSGDKLIELRPDRSLHFEINNLSNPVDARVIGPNRVLIAEYLGRRVTERDFEGKILWEMPIEMPIACQRLPWGDTFIATRRQLLIVDADKKTTFAYFHQGGSISAAQRTRDGQMVLVASTGQCHWLDAQGRETKSFPLGYIYPLGGGLEVLPNRHLLVPLYRDSKIAEVDSDGKLVWQAAVPSPVSATRLPNGHILAVSMANQRVLEIDPQGDTVWSYEVEGRAWRARGR